MQVLQLPRWQQLELLCLLFNMDATEAQRHMPVADGDNTNDDAVSFAHWVNRALVMSPFLDSLLSSYHQK
jgi:hypothetical protein